MGHLEETACILFMTVSSFFFSFSALSLGLGGVLCPTRDSPCRAGYVSNGLKRICIVDSGDTRMYWETGWIAVEMGWTLSRWNAVWAFFLGSFLSSGVGNNEGGGSVDGFLPLPWMTKDFMSCI